MNGEPITARNHTQPQHGNARRPTRGMTLVELLVVIVIVTTLVTTAIPVLSPGGDSRKLREASRNVNAYLAGAQARAIETGRPFGVALHRLSNETDRVADNGVCVRLSYVEVPPPFAGFDSGSHVRVAISPNYNPTADSGPINQAGNNEADDIGPFRLQFVVRSSVDSGLPDGWGADLIPPDYLRPGDVIKTNGQRFVLVSRQQGAQNERRVQVAGTDGFFDGSKGVVDDNNVVTLLARPEGLPNGALLNDMVSISARYGSDGNPLPSPEQAAVAGPAGPYWTAPAPYKIYRQPTPAAGEPLQLPDSAAIDLQASGFLGGSNFYTPQNTGVTPEETVKTDEVMILFSPEGAISRVAYEGAGASPTLVSGSVALCVGQRELIPAEPAETSRTDVSNAYPVDPLRDVADTESDEGREAYAKYNWLNTDTRWVVLGSQSGSVLTVENAFVTPAAADANSDGMLSLAEQLAAARDNAPGRLSSGGR